MIASTVTHAYSLAVTAPSVIILSAGYQRTVIKQDHLENLFVTAASE
jgi:hypothetical protein